MAFGESVFDFLLAQEQPIQGVIELGFLDGGIQTEQGSQRGGSGVGMKAAGGSEFGGRFEKEAAKGTESGSDVAVRSGAENQESVGGGDERFAFENTAEGDDLSGGPRGEIGEGVFDNLCALAAALAEEDGGRGVAVGDGLDVHGYIIPHLCQFLTFRISINMGTT